MAKSGAILLLTRPEPASRRFAELLAARFPDLPVTIAPAVRIVAEGALPEISGAVGLIFTSENAVAAFARLSPRRDLPAFCVGPRSAEAARASGFDASEGPGDAETLAEMIAAEAPPGPLFWPRGTDVAFDIAAALGRGGISVQSAVLYRQEPLPAGPQVRALLAGTVPVIVPLFSAKGAEAVALWPARKAPLWVAAIGPRVAEAAMALAPERLECAARPDAGGLAEAVAALLGPASP